MDKFCVNCEYMVPAMVLLCKHPNLVVSPVTGKPKTEMAGVVRFTYTKCGPGGMWFKEKLEEVKPVNWWNKLLGWKN